MMFVLLIHSILLTFDKVYAEALQGFGEISPMQYDLLALIHHVSVRPFVRRLKSPGFSALYRTPKEGLFCKKLVIIDMLDFE